MSWFLDLLSRGSGCLQCVLKLQFSIFVFARVWIPRVDYLLKWFPKRTSLLDLPPEILHEIFKHLDFKDLLSARMVCNRTRSVTKTRQLWENLAQEIQASPSASPTEAQFDSYSDSELEEWVIRRCRVQYLWKNPERIKLRTRIIDLDIPLSEARLLPGGRWVLGMTHNSKVYFWDLEYPQSIPQLLVDAGAIDEQTGLRDDLDSWSFWESSDRSRISLRMVLFRQIPPMGTPHSRFCFYEVQSEGHGPRATLNVRLVNTLRYLSPERLAVALTEEYMVNVQSQTQLPSRVDPQILSIFKYTPGNENLEPFVVDITSWDMMEARILFNNRIILLGMGTMDIYSLEQLFHGGLSDVFHPLHQLPLENCRVSQPIPIRLGQDQPTEVRMSCLSYCIYQGLSFKKDVDSSVEIIHQEYHRPRNVKPLMLISPGYLHSVLLVREGRDDVVLEILAHSWDSESEGLIRHSIPLPEKVPAVSLSKSIGFCEGLGRIVTFGLLFRDDYNKKFMVIDLL